MTREKAYRVHPKFNQTLALISGIKKTTLDGNPNWIAFSARLNSFRWHILPESRFNELYSHIEIEEYISM